jgi:predicted MFS family arabinose efflux permease
MAVIGMTIGATFALSLVAGPVLTNWIGVPGIFALTGALALAAIGLLRWAVPEAPPAAHAGNLPGLAAFGRVLADGQLARLNFGIFALHALLMALFVQVPFELRAAGVAAESHWQVYLAVMAASVALMLPSLGWADRPSRSKLVFNAAVAVLATGQLILALAGARLWWLCAGLVVFFAAFNLLEATLPSLTSKYAPPALKGTAVGVYSSVQFLGAFVGAVAGGWLAQHSGAAAVFGFGIVLTLIWLVASATMAPPPAMRPGNYSMGET